MIDTEVLYVVVDKLRSLTVLDKQGQTGFEIQPYQHPRIRTKIDHTG
jgi:hypothetical protein